VINCLENLQKILEPYPWSYPVITVAALFVLAALVNWVTKKILVRGTHKIVKSLSLEGSAEQRSRLLLISRLANIIPLLVLTVGVTIVPGLPVPVLTLIRKVCSSGVLIVISLAVSEVLNLINMAYQRRPDADSKPIKGYLQVTKILVFVIAVVLIIANFLDRSPMILLSGIGAVAAVLMLIFQDTILSLVASIQLGSNDMVRVGDWIEMPSQNADGDVIDIALHTVKVQNWDKTITTLPIRKLITDSFKNWRGMTNAGGRRIMRSIYIDQKSIRFLEQKDIDHLKQFVILDEYLKEKQLELTDWNQRLAESGANPINSRRVTNLGTFRAYISQYLSHNPHIHKDMIAMVRQLQPGVTGIPLQVYCFTNDIRWVVYENIQADLFDHLLAIMPEFGLRVFQQCSDSSGFILPMANAPEVAQPKE